MTLLCIFWNLCFISNTFTSNSVVVNGLQFALHHLSTWLRKWNLSQTRLISFIFFVISVKSLLTEFYANQMENSICRIVQKIPYSPNRTNRSNRQASTRLQEDREIFLSVANECKCQMENSICRIVQKILYSSNRRNRLNRQASTGSKKIVKYFQVSLMRCKCQMENSICRIVKKILYSQNRTNRSNS